MISWLDFNVKHNKNLIYLSINKETAPHASIFDIFAQSTPLLLKSA